MQYWNKARVFCVRYWIHKSQNPEVSWCTRWHMWIRLCSKWSYYIFHSFAIINKKSFFKRLYSFNETQICSRKGHLIVIIFNKRFVTLPFSIIHAIPSYVILQSTVILKNLCDEIDSKCRGVNWGDSLTQRHVHLASWTTIFTLKTLEDWGYARPVTWVLHLWWKLIGP